ncbi:MAG: hypothetical protein A2145_03540 [candidate division Zixibacteria bacterium RBG_16_40_9]|nr:MAG: hypothetical protein A2145_03540 [candidate division Zixibacteria bacterium RBG_16_40_9]
MKKLILIALVSILAIGGCTSGRIVIVGESESTPATPKNQGRVIAAQKHVESGKKFLKKKKYQKAEREFLAAIELDPRNQEAHYYLGLTYYRWKKYDDCREPFLVAIKLNPDDPDWVCQVRIYLGLSFEYERDYDRAEREFYLAMTLNPSNDEAKHCWERVKYKHKKHYKHDDDDDEEDEDEEDDD